MALVHGLPRAEPLWKVAPVRPSPDPVENPVDHLPVITLPSTPPIADRQKRPQLLPLSVCQITPPHARTTSRTAQSHMIDRTGSSCVNVERHEVSESSLTRLLRVAADNLQRDDYEGLGRHPHR
jgi:hypothetical protein